MDGVSWLLDNGLAAVFALALIAAAVYVGRDKIGERMSKAWREVAEASEARVDQLEEQVERQAAEIDALKRQVDVLAARPDLTTAITALAEHERRAEDRHSALLEALKSLVVELGQHTGDR